MRAKLTTVKDVSEVEAGDVVRTSGGTFDYMVVRNQGGVISTRGVANDGRTFQRFYTNYDLRKGNLKKVTY